MALDNTSIMKAAYLRGTNDFMQRVPDPTKAGLAATQKFLFNPMNRKYLNEFMDILVNRIARVYVHGKTFKNRLGAFKKERITYGSTVEEIGLAWIKAHSYDYNDTAAILRVVKPEGKSVFHTINRRDRYDITIEEDDLRMAFTEENGLNDLIARIMEVPTNSDEYDEYRIMLNLFKDFEQEHGIFKVHIDEVSDYETAKAALRTIRTYAGKIQFPSTLYNALDIEGVPTFAKPDECVMLTTPDFLSYLDVEALSQLFHVGRADLPYRVIVVDSLPIEDARAIITSEDAFICHDTVYDMDSFYNPATRSTNYFLHHQGIYSLSPFVPMVMLTVGEGTEVDAIEATYGNIVNGYISAETGEFTAGTPGTVGPGSTIQLMGYREVSYTGGDGNYTKLDALDASFITAVWADPAPNSVTAALAGKSPWVDRLGVLHIPSDIFNELDAETASSVQVRVAFQAAGTEDDAAGFVITISADGNIVEVNEKTDRAARKFYEGQALVNNKPTSKNNKKSE